MRSSNLATISLNITKIDSATPCKYYKNSTKTGTKHSSTKTKFLLELIQEQTVFLLSTFEPYIYFSVPYLWAMYVLYTNDCICYLHYYLNIKL